MGNRDIEEARRYHDATKHSYMSIRTSPHYLDWENRPLPFKVYSELLLIELPKDFLPPQVSALTAIATPEVESPKEGALDLPMLAQVLFFTGGVTRKKVLPGGGTFFFRAAACAGALYPVEVYVVCADIPGLAAGVYHFSPADFALRRLREGDCRGELYRAAGEEKAIAEAAVSLVFTAVYWRSAWKYRGRCYRYCFWDSGTMASNLLATTAAFQLRAKIITGFVDAIVDRLLGIDGKHEVSLFIVPLGTSQAVPTPDGPVDIPPLDLQTLSLSKTEIEYPEIRRMHFASALQTEEEVKSWRGPLTPASPEIKGALNTLQPLEGASTSLQRVDEVILRRGSTRKFGHDTISFSQLSTILHSSTRGAPADFLDGPQTSLLDIYLIVNAVDELLPGTYFYSQENGGLELLKEGDFRAHAGYLCLEQNLGADASVVFFFLADLQKVLGRYGNRVYRAALLVWGVVGGKMYLGAYALGLGATGLTFYDDDVIEFFSPHARGKDAIFIVAVGLHAARKLN
ncbi:MAG: SagB/ThcOx family dehydrogenase [Dehalococcoidia bacterium]